MTQNTCSGCPVQQGTHKPAGAVHQIAEPAAQAVEPVAWPKDVQDVRDFMDTNYQVAKFAREDQAPDEDDRYTLSAHDFLEAVNWWADFPHVPRVTDVPALRATPPAQAIKANCYSDDNGDTWRDRPDDCEFVDGLKVGDTFELQASIRAWSETYRVTKAPDEASDEYEVELVSTDAPALAAPQAQDVLRDTARYQGLRLMMQFEKSGKTGKTVMTLSAPLDAAATHDVHNDWMASKFDASVDRTVDAAIAASAAKGGEA